jgi:hypothetical protein
VTYSYFWQSFDPNLSSVYFFETESRSSRVLPGRDPVLTEL